MLEFDSVHKHDVKNAVIYARISSKAQEKKGMGITSQITYCQQYANWKGYQVHETFKDSGITGSRADRDGIKSLLLFLKQHKSKRHVVIVDDISRLARDIRVHLDLRDAIDKCDAILESPSMTFGTDSDGRYFENMQALSAQHHREKNAEQTKKRQQARIIDGYYPFPSTLGYKHERIQGHGKVMIPHEPLATILQQALEGYASGLFESQADVARFLEKEPAFPRKTRYGTVTIESVNRILKRVIYAGYIEMPEWNIPLRKGKHEGLISFETYQKIQDRLKGRARPPALCDFAEDFPLRGFVNCTSCHEPMTACWSKGKSGKRHPYYVCQRRGCEYKGRSIRKAQIETDFEQLLMQVQPQKLLVDLVFEMFKQAWHVQNDNEAVKKRDLEKRLIETDKKIKGFLDRIIDSDSQSVIKAYEQRIDMLENEKLIIEEKMDNTTQNRKSFREVFKHTLVFLSNPYNIWTYGGLAHKRTVLKLAFKDRLTYCKNTGFQTPHYACIFKALHPENISNSHMAAVSPSYKKNKSLNLFIFLQYIF